MNGTPSPFRRSRLPFWIPAGIQNGKRLRLKGEGVPYIHNPNKKGDLYIEIRIDTPERLSSKSKALFEELAQQLGENENPKPVRLSTL